MEQIIKYAVGIDVDKEKLEVKMGKLLMEDYQIKIVGSRKFPNTAKGFELLDAWISKRYKSTTAELSIVLEATGVYHEHLAYALKKSGRKMSVVLPNKAKHYMLSLGNKSKNDQIDAGGLMRMGLQQQLSVWEPMAEDLYRLRTLTRQQERLQKMQTDLRNQLEAHRHMQYVDELVINSLNSMLQTIKEQIKEITKAIEQVMEQDASCQANLEVMGSVNGVGTLTVAVLLAETGSFELFRNQRQLISFSGYDVVENQSGKRIGKTKISKKGNSHIRRIMHMAAWNVVRLEVKPFKDLFDRVYERTGVKMKAYVAVQRKLLAILFALHKKGEKFREDYLDEIRIDKSQSSSFRISQEQRSDLVFAQ